MIKKEQIMRTTIVASEDKKNTYEIEKVWDEKLRKGLVIELYPTISANCAERMDLSTMHLQNHCSDFDWGGVKIVNLYSSVFSEKPGASALSYDSANIAYIEELLESKDISDMDIVIAWGSSLSTHQNTIEAKIDLLNVIKDKGLSEQAKCIVAGIEMETQGIHPLFLGLHFSKLDWYLEDYNIDSALAELNELLGQKATRNIENKKSSDIAKSKEKKKGEN